VGVVVPVRDVIPAAVVALVRHAPLTPEKVAFAWRSAVGPAIDSATVIQFRDRVLYVRARDEAWQREVERSAALIRSRLDTLLGERVVSYIEVSQA
jgi:hypothetical protein